MTNYTTTFFMNDENFSFDIYTNHIFKAIDDEDALRIASTLESNFDKYIKVSFNKDEKDIIVEIIENGYFNKVYLGNFEYYDETKGEFQKLVKNGYEVYPVANPDCCVEVGKDEFIDLLLNHYSEYLIDRPFLTFEAISYNVKNVDVDSTA
ncbi:hypothetical protein ABD87_14965 [Lysinibacillus sphaericus]|uniref:hypothetical protein n=1 Tax=Lysinibacillus sphaericus TaxID=1421 RepID=UPI0018CDB29C|nr:hypothetical protein [Lysinibacillus sphaericus]MBG9730794.1 hypothetical protein [Lysinibacillus sphaericus]